MGCLESTVYPSEDYIRATRPSALSSAWRAHGVGWTQGTVTSHQYWDSVRDDVRMVMEDLAAIPAQQLTPGERDYLSLLQRWMRKYADQYPANQRPPRGDPNRQPLPTPDNVSSLREWMTSWEPLRFDVGHSAWDQLPFDVIKRDQTTTQQETTLAFRAKRKYPLDEKRMRIRRERLARYFQEKYEMPEAYVRSYLQWADHMREGQTAILQLCQNQP